MQRYIDVTRMSITQSTIRTSLGGCRALPRNEVIVPCLGSGTRPKRSWNPHITGPRRLNLEGAGLTKSSGCEPEGFVCTIARGSEYVFHPNLVFEENWDYSSNVQWLVTPPKERENGPTTGAGAAKEEKVKRTIG
jgi:hypothetical protein